jgi:hypothetical protein
VRGEYFFTLNLRDTDEREEISERIKQRQKSLHTPTLGPITMKKNKYNWTRHEDEEQEQLN